ncbi:Translocase of chloroplast 34 homolog, chloroplastic [Geodia barretti]|uniref:Translocase of chloroplast 34 homolog, chloroplastic n=1 Tax=Geodia barretti TaxID=519541 RepID=A0AA35R713_GEOBA|nr:Translocase of chloroplast 34 homolog, chloroplastic [Geodia barretti]
MDRKLRDSGASIDLEASLESLKLKMDEKGEVRDWIENRKRMEILLTGRTGTGKSTLVNALVGVRAAETGSNLLVTTKHVTGHKVMSTEGMEIVVWDSPGLQDGSGEEDDYLAKMKENCSNVDIIIYCIDASVARAQLGGAAMEQQNDLCAIKQLTANFGPKVWEHSIFVLTRANSLEASLNVKGGCDDKFKERLEDWEKRIHAALEKEGVPKEIVNEVPVKPAGHPKKPNLPGGHECWLSALWFTFIKRAKDPSQPMFARVSQHRFKKKQDVTPDDFKKEGCAQPIFVDPLQEQYLVYLFARLCTKILF